MAVDLFANAASTTLAAGIAAGAVTLTVASSTLFPAVTTTAGTQFRVIIDAELFIVTNVTGTTWTVTPGAEGTTQAAHALNAPVTAILTAAALGTLGSKTIPAWSANTTYAASQLVVYLSALYLRNAAGTSGTTFDVAQWTVLTSAQSVLAGTTPPDAPGVTYVVVSANTAPTQVTGLTTTPSSGQVALSWTAPANGGSAITDYLVQYRTPSGSGTYTIFTHAAQTTTTITVTGLTNGSAYGFTVAAVNAVGTGAVSVESVATPLVAGAAAATGTVTLGGSTTANAVATAPGQVTGLSGTPASTSVALTWTAPASNGGSAITDYFVEFRTGAAAFAAFTHTASTAATQTVTGLTAATSYDFRVSAVNAVGTGTASTVYTVATSAAAVNNLPLADTFVRANQTGIGTPSDGKVGYTVIGAINIVSNAGRTMSASGDSALRDTGVVNMKVSADVILGTGTSYFHFVVRSDAAQQNFYLARLNLTAVTLYKVVAGTWTQIGATNNTTNMDASPETFFFNVNGSTLTFQRDTAVGPSFTVTDTSITTGTYGGVGTEENVVYTFKNVNMVAAT